MTMAYPSLWTPQSESRFGPWWRKPWRNLSSFMAGHIKYGPGGHMLYGPTGHMVHTCSSPHTCMDCGAANQMTATFSGITLAACQQCNGAGSYYEMLINFNTTFTLTWLTTCIWTAHSTASLLVAKFGSAGNCVNSYTTDWGIELTRFLSDSDVKWRLTAGTNAGGFFSSEVFGTAGDCYGPISFPTNAINACDYTAGSELAYGGSATVAAV